MSFLLRTIAAAVLAAGTLGISGPALAVDATYPPGEEPAVTAPQEPVEAGSSVTLTASGFRAGSTVTFTITSAEGDVSAAATGDSVLVTGTATADDAGVATATLQLPEDASGTLNVLASGVAPDGSPLEVRSTLTIAGDGGGTGGDLPRTGGSLTPLYIGLALLIAGVAFVVIARRRRGQQGSAA